MAESVAGQSLDTGLETVARLTPMLVGVEKIGIYQYDPLAGAFRLRHVTGLDRPAARALADRLIVLADLGLTPEDELLGSAAPWHITPPDWLGQLFGRPECYVWPLRARGDVLGALVTEPMPLLGRRLAILNGIAYQLAMAMENSRLTREVAQQERLERELEVGRDIQASFLPQAYPQADGWEICAYWQAARQVGGDFYDFIELSPGEHGPRWGIVIADVADKGVPAALFMALSRTLLRTVAIARVQPGATLGRVNDLILADARSRAIRHRLLWRARAGNRPFSLFHRRAQPAHTHSQRRRGRNGAGPGHGVGRARSCRLCNRKSSSSPATRCCSIPTGSPRRLICGKRNLGFRPCCGWRARTMPNRPVSCFRHWRRRWMLTLGKPKSLTI